ncbi:DNA alkylation repair protein [Echinicola sp. 20G]|uniref:DNA alkylation repair protein n=1 Tax=Echinicola sp. 20G TaxID=2781961 RepID=UPI00190FDBE8|nr:DNA alkylation repair protein [Echinicola sp. 20G]
MTLSEVLSQLEALGSERMRLQNAKRGAHDNQYGVKMGDIRALAKKIKSDHPLALQLWATENIDARLVAILIMKPKELSDKELDEMVKSLKFSQVSDWFNSYVIKEHPNKTAFREAWMNDKNPWAARAGWNLTSSLINKGAEGLDLNAILDRLEKEMGSAAPEAQWTMNFSLAHIGIHHPEYRERALEIGEKLGLYRDYPTSKGCTSPFAPIWINEMVSRKK